MRCDPDENFLSTFNMESSTARNSQRDGASSSQPATSAVSVKLPPYWPNDQALWFTQVEAQFTTHSVTAECTKYAYVVGSLQPDVAQEVRDLLLNPSTTEPYSHLKDKLIKRMSESEQKRPHQLLTAEELGDRKPTQLYRRMQQLFGERQLEPSIMKQLFLQHLPTNAQLILASSKDDLDTEGLTRLADKILEISSAQTSSPILTKDAPVKHKSQRDPSHHHVRTTDLSLPMESSSRPP